MAIQAIPWQGAVDDSGNEPQSPIFVLAGFISTYERWEKFIPAWQRLLDLSPKLEYFKMSEAMSLTGQFDKRRGWTATKRDLRVLAFANIIPEYVRTRISAWMRWNDFITHIRSLPAVARSLSTDTPYPMLLDQLILAVATFADHQRFNGPVDFVFDTQAGFSEEILRNWPLFKARLENSTRSDLKRFIGDAPSYQDEQKFLPLQAADLYAWEVRNNYVANHRVKNQTIEFPPTPALSALLPLAAINREYSTAEVIRLRNHLLDVGKTFTQQYPNIPLVPISDDPKERRKARRAARKNVSAKEPSSKKGRPS